MKDKREMHLIRLKSPVSVNFEVTSNCNWKCEFCSAANKLNENSKQYQSFEKIKDIIDELNKAEVLRINLFGGEPFLHPEIINVAKYANDSGLFVGFTSNGSKIDKQKADKLAKYVIGGSISIHGFKHTHEKITGVKNSFDKSIQALETMIDTGIQTGVCYTLTKRNFNDLDSFCDYVFTKYEDVKYFGVNRFIPQGRGLKNRDKLELDISEINKTLQILYNLKQKYKREMKITDGFPLCLIDEKYQSLIKTCSAGVSFGSVDEYGNVRFCSSSPHIIGNIFEESLENIWQNSKTLVGYHSLDWVSEECKKCNKFDRCLTGCRATRSERVYSPDVYLDKRENYEKA